MVLLLKAMLKNFSSPITHLPLLHPQVKHSWSHTEFTRQHLIVHLIMAV